MFRDFQLNSVAFNHEAKRACNYRAVLLVCTRCLVTTSPAARGQLIMWAFVREMKLADVNTATIVTALLRMTET